MADGFLIKQEKYLEAGIHIGTKLRVIDMRRFIYRTRNDGLYVLDLRKVDKRIRLAGKLLSQYGPKDIVVVASRAYSSAAASKFASVTGSTVVSGRFIPGRFTNVSRQDFLEPKIAIVCDPKGEHQAVIEAGKNGIPTIGLCDTDNFTTFIDWVVPCNNKGRRSLSLIFWLFAREMAMSSGKIATYDEFKPTLEEFEAQPEEKPAGEGAAVAEEIAQEGQMPSDAPETKAIAEEAISKAQEKGGETEAQGLARKKAAPRKQEKKEEA